MFPTVLMLMPYLKEKWPQLDNSKASSILRVFFSLSKSFWTPLFSLHPPTHHYITSHPLQLRCSSSFCPWILYQCFNKTLGFIGAKNFCTKDISRILSWSSAPGSPQQISSTSQNYTSRTEFSSGGAGGKWSAHFWSKDSFLCGCKSEFAAS